MATESETPPPAPAPSAGLLERMAAKFGFKTEDAAFAEIREELAAMTLLANEATAEVEIHKAEVTRQSSVITGLQAKISGIEAAVPGLSSAADPGAHVLQAITKATTDKIAEMGMKPDTAPGTDPSPDKADATMARADFDKLDTAKQNAFMRGGGKLTS